MKFYKSPIIALKKAKEQNKRVRWMEKPTTIKRYHDKERTQLKHEFLVTRRFYYLVD